jgi:hypothetical protein
MFNFRSWIRRSTALTAVMDSTRLGERTKTGRRKRRFSPVTGGERLEDRVVPSADPFSSGFIGPLPASTAQLSVVPGTPNLSDAQTTFFHNVGLQPTANQGPSQVVYLDFTGASPVTYNGPVVVPELNIPAFTAPGGLGGYEDEIISAVTDSLNTNFDGLGVTFTTDTPPDGQPHSTIYIGGNDAGFEQYGSYLGLAEDVDTGNQNPNDNALVFSDGLANLASSPPDYMEQLTEVIGHETGHLMGYAPLAGSVTDTGPLANVADVGVSLPGSTFASEGPQQTDKGQSLVSGPSTVSGAITGIAIHPLDPKILYVGTTNGGVWRTLNINATDTNSNNFPVWAPLTDTLPSLSVSAITFDAAATKAAYGTATTFDGTKDVVYAGTGTSGSASLGGGGVGLLKTTDGGQTWSVKGNNEFKGFKITSVLATQFRDAGGLHSVLLVGTRFDDVGTYHGDAGQVGVWRSTDGGDTWTRISGSGGLARGDVTDIKAVRDPAAPDSSIIYAANIGIVGGAGAGIYESTDGGLNWTNTTQKSNGSTNISGKANLVTNAGADYDLPTAQPFAIKLNVYATGDNAHNNAVTRIYAGMVTNAVTQRVTYWDRAPTNMWTTLLDSPASIEAGFPKQLNGNQALLHFAITPDPTTANRLFLSGDVQPVVAGSSTGVSDFVGRVFRLDTTVNYLPAVMNGTARGDLLIGNNANKTAPHADSRVIAFDSNGVMYEGDDGGIYRLLRPEAAAGNVANTSPQWISLNGNLQITEVGSAAYDPLNKEAVLGSQDTGVQKQTVPDPNAFPWTSFTTADGLTVQVGYEGSKTFYYSYSNTFQLFQRRQFDASGKLVTGITSDTQLNNSSLLLGMTDADRSQKFALAFVLNTVNPKKLLLGYTRLYKSEDRGDTVTTVADTAASAPRSGASPPAASGNPVQAVAYGGYEKDGSKNEAVIYRSRNGYLRAFDGTSWSADFNSGSTITQITVDPKNWRTAYAAGADGKIWLTINGGDSWTNLTDAARGASGQPTGALRTVQPIAIDTPDLHFHLRGGQDFDVSLRGAATLGDIKTFIEAQAPKSGNNAPLVTVTLTPGTGMQFSFVVKDLSSALISPDTFAITASADSPVVRELGLDVASITLDTGLFKKKDTIQGKVLTLTAPLGVGLLQNVTLDMFTNAAAGTGLHRSANNQDVLLVGGDKGIFRLINPLGDPSQFGFQATLAGNATRAMFDVAVPGPDNDLRITARQAGADLNDTKVSFVGHGATGPARISWNPVTKNLVFDLPTGLAAKDLLTLLNGPSVSTLMAMDSATPGQLQMGTYNYKISFVSASGLEGPLSAPKAVPVSADFRSVQLTGIPAGPTGTVARRIYRTSVNSSTYDLVGTVNNNTDNATFNDLTPDREQAAAPSVAGAATAAADGGAGGKLAADTYRYRFSFINSNGVESPLSDPVTTPALMANHFVSLSNIPTGPTGTIRRRIYRAGSADAAFTLIGTLNDNSTSVFTDRFGALVDVTQADPTRPAKPTGITAAAQAGGRLAIGTFKYRVTILDATGVESNASDEITGTTAGTNRSINLTGIAARSAAGSIVRIYRTQLGGTTYNLIATITDITVTQLVDIGGFGFDPTLVKDNSLPTAPNLSSGAVTPSAIGSLAMGTYFYRITFLDNQGVESNVSAATMVTVASNNSQVGLMIPAGPTGTNAATSRRVYRGTTANGPFVLIGTINDNTTLSFADSGFVGDAQAVAANAAFSVAATGDNTTGAGNFDLLINAQVTGGSGTTPAVATVKIPGDNNDLKITAKTNGDQFNGAIAFINTGKAQGSEVVTWNDADRLLVFDIAPNATTANDIMTAIGRVPNLAAGALFKVEVLAPDPNTPNTGLGVITNQANGLPMVATTRGLPNFQWTRFGGNLPNALVSTITYTPPLKKNDGTAIGDVLMVGLRGRGIWEISNASAVLGKPSVLQLTTNGDRLLLQLDPSVPSGLPQVLQVFQQNDPNGAKTLKGTFPMASISQIKVTGSAANDTLQVDPRIRVPGGIVFDGGGGAGTDTLVVTSVSGQVITQRTGAASAGTLQISNPSDLNDKGLTINFDRTSQVQANLLAAQAFLPAGDVNTQLAQVKAGLTFLTAPGPIDDALSAGFAKLPVIGPGIVDLLNGGLGPVAPVAIADPSGGPGQSQGTAGEEEGVGNANKARSPVMSLLLGTASSAFSLGEIGTTLNTLELLRAALDGLDATPGNVMLTPNDRGFTYDVTIVRTAVGGADPIALSLGTGTVALTSNVMATADIKVHFKFGVDANGFFFDTTPTDEITITNLKVSGAADTSGRFGLLGVDGPGTTVTIDPGVTYVVDLKEPDADPFTNQTDNFVRTAEPISKPDSIFTFTATTPVSKTAVMFAGTLNPASFVKDGTAPFALAGNVTIKWTDVNNLGTPTVTANGSDPATAAFLLLQNLTPQTIINGLTTMADTIQAKSQVDVLMANLPLTSKIIDKTTKAKIDSTLYNILNKDNAIAVLQTGDVEFQTEITNDGTSKHFTIGIIGDQAPTTAELGLKIGDPVQFFALEGTFVTGMIESLDLDSVGIKYASTDTRSPDQDNPYFKFVRSGAAGDQFKALLGKLTDASFVTQNVFTVQDIIAQLAAAQGIDVTKATPDQLAAVAVDAAGKTLTLTPIMTPSPLQYAEPLDVTSSANWLTFDSTARLPITVSSEFRVPVLVDLTVNPATPKSVFVSLDNVPAVEYHVNESIKNPHARTLTGVVLEQDSAVPAAESVSMNADYRLTFIEPGTDTDKRGSLDEFATTTKPSIFQTSVQGSLFIPGLIIHPAVTAGPGALTVPPIRIFTTVGLGTDVHSTALFTDLTGYQNISKKIFATGVASVPVVHKFTLAPPQLALTNLAVQANGQALLVGSSTFNAFDLSQATIDVFYDTDTTGFNGTLIASLPVSEAGTFTTSFPGFSGLAAQPYYFYAVADDGVNPLVESDYAGPLTPASLSPVNTVPAAQTTTFKSNIVFSAANKNAITVDAARTDVPAADVTLTAQFGQLQFGTNPAAASIAVSSAALNTGTITYIPPGVAPGYDIITVTSARTFSDNPGQVFRSKVDQIQLLSAATADLSVSTKILDGTGNPTGFLAPGDPVQIVLTASNLSGVAGVVKATTVAVTSALPFGVTLGTLPASVVASTGAYVPSTGIWTIGDLAVGAMATLTLTGTVRTDVPLTLLGSSASITGAQADFAPLNNQAVAALPVPKLITVSSSADTGAGTLRQALVQANGDPRNSYVIRLPNTLGGTITLASALSVTGNITIVGPGAGNLTISGNDASRILTVSAGANLIVSGLTLTKGKAAGVNSGGAISNAGSLTLSKVNISASNSAQDGGAIYNTGTLLIDQGMLSTNKATANGGAISSVGGSLNLQNSTINGNTAMAGGSLYIKDANDSISGSTIKDSIATTEGGGIKIQDGHVTISDSMVMNNKAPIGGGIIERTTDASNFATLDLLRDNISGNMAVSATPNDKNRGGGLANYGGSLVRIDSSTISGNTASSPAPYTISPSNSDGTDQSKAGGIYNGAGSQLFISRSTVSGNTAPRQSGGIDNPGILLITESTFANNQATRPLPSGAFGGAIDSKGRVTVKTSTFSGNTATSGGGGIALFFTPAQEGTLYLESSIVAGNTGGTSPDVSVFPNEIAEANSLGSNLVGVGDPKIAWGSTDQFGTATQALDPLLATAGLQDNGGPTKTFLLQAGSPAIDAGALNPGDATDQRGKPRVVGTASDVGSVEVTVTGGVVSAASSGTPATESTGVSVPAALTGGSGTVTVAAGPDFVEGMVGNLNATFDDPGSTDDASAYTLSVDWGDGTTSTSPDVTISGAATPYTIAGSHTYNDDGSFNGTITITKNGVVNTGTFVAVVGDADALAADSSSPANVSGTEGTPLNQVVVAAFDSAFAGNTAADFTATIKWGDKATSTGTVQLVTPAASGQPAVYQVLGSHLYTEDDTYASKVTITDDMTMQSLVIPTTVLIAEDPTFTVTASPTITTADGTPTGAALKEGVPMQNILLATFQNANGVEAAADFVATIDWGDGSSSDAAGTVTLVTPAGPNPVPFYEVRGSHVYTEDRTWPIKVTVLDTADTEVEPGAPTIVATTQATATEDTFVTAGGQALTGHTGASLDNVMLGTFQHSDGWEDPTSDFQVSINWGDGTPADDPSATGFIHEDDVTGIYTIFGSHTYTAASPPGGYQISVTITDMSSTDDLSVPPLQATISNDTATITTVNAPPTFTSLDHTTFTVGTAGTFTVTTHSVGPVPVLTESDNLPANSGITFHDNGDGTATIAGTPAAGTGGGYTLNITANNGIPPNGTQTFTLNVNQAPSITSPDHATFSVGKLNVFTVTTQGFPANVALTETDNLPAGSGVSFHDNGDGTATIAGTPAAAAAGSFTFNITADNGTAPQATQTLTLNITATGTNQAFVQALYQTVLDRTGPTGDVNAWVAAINAGVPRIAIAQAFWESPEHRAIQVRSYYATYLRRTPSPAEVQGWVGVFQAGATENDVIQGFVLSPEYLQAQDSDSAFVSGLYNDILGRPADAPGLAFWVQMLQDSTTRTTVARAFLTFPEAIKRTVDIDYATLLQRPANPAEEQTWINALATGFSPSSIAEQFLASDEFFIRF